MSSKLLYLYLLLFPSQVLGACWFPDGQTLASQDVPCSNSANATCCGAGYACMSNNICKVTQYVRSPPTVGWIRGSCTDRSWSDPNCPLFCSNPAIGDNQAGGLGMQPCPNNDRYFYCMDSAQTSVNCAKGDGVVVFKESPSTLTVIGITTTTSSSSIQSSTTASTLSTSASQSAATSSRSSEQSSRDSNLGAAIGAGVGVPFGLVALGIIGYIIFRIRRTRKRDRAANTRYEGYPKDPSYQHTSADITPESQIWSHHLAQPPVEVSSQNYPPQELPSERYH